MKIGQTGQQFLPDLLVSVRDSILRYSKCFFKKTKVWVLHTKNQNQNKDASVGQSLLVKETLELAL